MKKYQWLFIAASVYLFGLGGYAWAISEADQKLADELAQGRDSFYGEMKKIGTNPKDVDVLATGEKCATVAGLHVRKVAKHGDRVISDGFEGTNEKLKAANRSVIEKGIIFKMGVEGGDTITLKAGGIPGYAVAFADGSIATIETAATGATYVPVCVISFATATAVRAGAEAEQFAVETGKRAYKGILKGEKAFEEMGMTVVKAVPIKVDPKKKSFGIELSLAWVKNLFVGTIKTITKFGDSAMTIALSPIPLDINLNPLEIEIKTRKK